MLLLNRKGNLRANKILATVISLFAVSMVYYVAFWTGYTAKYHWLDGWVAPIPFLYGPLIYLYIKVLNENQTKANFNLHYLPFWLHSVFMVPLILRNLFGVIPILRDNYFKPFGNLITPINYTFIALQCISLLVYACFIFIEIRKEKNKLNSFAIPGELLKYHWLKQVAWFYLIFGVVNISYWVLVVLKLLQLEYDYAISITISIFIYMVGYMGFKQPAVFNERLINDEQEDTPVNFDITHIKAAVRYENSTLKTEEAEHIYKDLITLLDKEKPYLKNDLKIQHLATQLGISTHHMSQAINAIGGQNYAELINNYRIQEAQRLLSDPHNTEKILSVAFDVGYNNKATFNSTFKKITGMSPSDFRKNADKQIVA